MDLHEQIMSIGVDQVKALHVLKNQNPGAYRIGHQDARHAAAALAVEHTAAADEMRKEVERCFDIAQALDAMNPKLEGAFTGTPSARIQRQLDAMAETL